VVLVEVCVSAPLVDPGVPAFVPLAAPLVSSVVTPVPVT
jgi:hypothetical protein